MKDIENVLDKTAKEQGFFKTAFLPVEQLVFVDEYRKYCQDNVCGNYNKLPMCPPKCGTVEEMKKTSGKYQTAFIMQTVWDLKDYSDRAAIAKMKGAHNRMTKAVKDAARKEGVTGIVMSAGPTAEDSCMSAYCIDASKMAGDCGMDYWMEEGKVSFFSLFLYHEKIL